MDLLLVGGGPRSIIQANTEMVFLLMYRQHFDNLTKLGANYNIKLQIVEKNSQVAGGDAFSHLHTGTVNTPVEDDIVFPLPVPTSNQSAQHFAQLLSYKTRYDKKFASDMESYKQQLQAQNVSASVMFQHSVGPMSTSESGKLEHSRAYLLRRTMGQEELETFESICEVVRSQIPFFQIHVLSSCLVERIIANPASKPEVLVRSVRNNAVTRIVTDYVRLNTGTCLTSPIDDVAVKRISFCHSMNGLDVCSYLQKRNLLDHKGKLRSGKKILSGGLSLSGLDQINALDRAMDLFEEDGDSLLGYRVRQDAIRKYKGALSIVSHTRGKACFPRQSYGIQWQQHTKVIGTTKNMHALFIHDHGQHVFHVWTDLLEAAVARAMNKTPDQVALGKRSSSTSELLRSQFENTLSHLENRRQAGIAELNGDMEAKKYFIEKSTQTLYGAWRQAALSCISGFGLEATTDEIMEEMDSFAPITWGGRHSLIYHRAELTAISDPSYTKKVSNMPLMSKFNNLMEHVVASPAEIHSMMHLLFESGIANHVTASYSDIGVDDSGERLQLHGEEYDAFIVSPIFSSGPDVVRKSLTGQVGVYDDKYPLHGKVGKFRRLADSDGAALHIEDNGLSGKGFRTMGEGGESRTGIFATDVNNRASAVERASSITMRRMARAHLSAAGLDAHSTLDKIYEEQQATELEYENEVAMFQEHFEEAMEMHAYLRAIRELTRGNSERFVALYDAGIERSGRKRTMHSLLRSDDGDDVRAGCGYFDSVDKIEVFKTPTRDEYFGRFVDTTEAEDKAAYLEALDKAERHLMGLRKVDDLAMESVLEFISEDSDSSYESEDSEDFGI